MQKECGIEWAEKIFNIGSAYIEQRKKIIESNGCAILQPLIVD